MDSWWQLAVDVATYVDAGTSHGIAGIAELLVTDY